MGKKSNIAIANLLNEVNATEDEKVFLEYAKATAAQDSNYTLTISLLLLTKHMSRCVKESTQAQAQLVLAGKRSVRAMTGLTIALILVGLIQAVGILMPYIR